MSPGAGSGGAGASANSSRTISSTWAWVSPAEMSWSSPPQAARGRATRTASATNASMLSFRYVIGPLLGLNGVYWDIANSPPTRPRWVIYAASDQSHSPLGLTARTLMEYSD